MTRRSFLAAALAADDGFRWPNNKRAALSLTFDDARPSQIDAGVDVLNRHGIKATFYLVPRRVNERLEGWKRAAADGHEIANHSRTHPCTANYRFSLSNALENYTEDRMAAELDGANSDLLGMLGVKPISFAYPCGLTYFGRGENTRSYIPLVAKRFLTGRGYLNESANDPKVCDFAYLMGTAFDDMPYEQMQKLVTAAANEGRWLIFVGHEIGRPAFQTTHADALDRLCRYAKDPANGIWVDTVANVATYLKKQRGV